MAQQLKTKHINVVPGQLFCRQCKTKFLLDTDLLHLRSRQCSICYRYWQWINWISNTKEKAPINWHFTCQLARICENFRERYFRSIQSWLFENPESDSYDKNDVKVKVNNLVRLHKTMQQKLNTASYSEQIQTLTLVPNKWSGMYC